MKDYLPKLFISIGFSSVAILAVRPSSFALYSIITICFCNSWIFISAAFDYFIISPSDISIFERSSNVKPDIKVVLLYEPLPSLSVPIDLRPLGVVYLFRVILLLLLDTRDRLTLLKDLIVYNSFSKFI